MFGDRKEPPRRGGLSVIGGDVTVSGDIATDGDLHVDGRIDGDIACGSLIQGPAGHIVGTVTAKTARLAGAIEGAVNVDTLTIEASARIRGDCTYTTVTIETGAQLDGRMTHRGAGDTAEPPLRLVDATDAGR